MKILIAEDDAASRKILEAILRSLGHEVVAANNGQEAWEAFDRDPVRLIVSDWLMAVVDGLALCKKVRARPKTPYTYFIMLTARSEREKYEEAMAGGVDDFLAKPLSRTDLTIRLRVAERILGYTTQIRELKKLLPICMYCKKIRDDQDYWHGVEAYIHAHTGTDFSHSICPVCYEQHIKPQLAELGCEEETPV
ncbi:MAG: response regulator [Verrucomicrobia bacterium]|nr:response regulator [Verrucomicrobiota bacterium]